MRIFSPAKINLGLWIGERRREDGLHELQSVLVPINFGDYLVIHPAKIDSFTTQNELSPPFRDDFEQITEKNDPTNNLVYKVLEKSRPYRSSYFHVHLRKQIPLGSGLGGGSSNAGKLLQYTARFLLETEGDTTTLSSQKDFKFWKNEHLYPFALSLGSDIPFFLQDQAAIVTGIGGNILPIPVTSSFGVIALTKLIISTKEVYHLLKRPFKTQETNLSTDYLPSTQCCQEIKAILRDSIDDAKLAPLLQNHFEPVVYKLYPLLKNIKYAFMSLGAPCSFLSGTGSSVYCLVDSEEKQATILDSMKRQFPDCLFLSFTFLTNVKAQNSSS